MNTSRLDASRTPVIIGSGQITDTETSPDRARSPIELIRDAALQAASDSGAGKSLLGRLDSITMIRLFADSVPRFQSPFGKLTNAPWSLAKRLGASPQVLLYSPAGGDTPQVMLAHACSRIAKGESQAALIAGGEALRTELAAKRAGLVLDWSEEAPSAPDIFEPARSMYTEQEVAHGMRSAIAMYALIGQAIRASSNLSVDAYRQASGELFARFAAVARQNPLATRRQGYSAGQLAEVTPENPYVGFPYTKRMTASAYIDQSAALLVVSSALADEMGVAHEKRVYLHGAAHAHDPWFVSERTHLDSSPAMRLTTQHALAQADKTLQDISFLELYSCFPSAVQMACKELGISPDDPRGLTVTGGLPYFGGPGNNYATHAIAEMVQRVRNSPGSFGLVGANGGLVTKQAVGIYSTVPPRQRLIDEDAVLQAQIDREPTLRVASSPQGEATIETYSVLHNKSGPQVGLIFGRLVSTGERFLANTPSDRETLEALQNREAIGLRGLVRQENNLNIFIPDFSV